MWKNKSCSIRRIFFLYTISKYTTSFLIVIGIVGVGVVVGVVIVVVVRIVKS